MMVLLGFSPTHFPLFFPFTVPAHLVLPDLLYPASFFHLQTPSDQYAPPWIHWIQIHCHIVHQYKKTESKYNTKRIHWLQIQCFGLYYTPFAPNHLTWFLADTCVKEYESIQGAFKNHSAPIILSYMQYLVVHDVGQVVTVLFCRQTVSYALLYFCCYCVFVFFWCCVSRHV